MATTITGEDITTGSGFDSRYQGSSRPMFAVEKTIFTSGNVGNYDVVKVNNGNHFDATSGRFTAPVAGIYTFNVRGGLSGPGTTNSHSTTQVRVLATTPADAAADNFMNNVIVVC